MHWQAFQFVATIKSLLPSFFIDTCVLEIGSHSVNGSIRELFDAEHYVGLDLSEGAGVDIVMSGHEYRSKNTFDVTISCECFEHNPHFQKTLENMIKHTKDNGLIIFSCATTNRPEHGTTRTNPALSPGTSSIGWDYYKNLTESDFEGLENQLAGWFFYTNKYSHDIYFIGVKSEEMLSQLNIIHKKLKSNLEIFEALSENISNAELFFPQLRNELLTPSLLFIIKHQSYNKQLIQNRYFQQFIMTGYQVWPHSWELNFLLASIKKLEGHLYLALVFAKRAVNYSQKSAFCLNHYASLCIILKRNKLAISNLKDIPDLYHNAPILFKLSSVYVDNNKYEEAIYFIDKAINLQNNNAVFLNTKLKILKLANKNNTAIECAEKIISLIDCPDWIFEQAKRFLFETKNT
jgi:tetratricopeptide (TPR) repeat protein